MSVTIILSSKGVTQNISKFFGMGKSKANQQTMSVDDIDQAISEAVIKNDRS